MYYYFARDMHMLDSAKNFYRIRVLHYKKQKTLNAEQSEEFERCRQMLKYTDKLVQTLHLSGTPSSHNLHQQQQQQQQNIVEGSNGDSNV